MQQPQLHQVHQSHPLFDDEQAIIRAGTNHPSPVNLAPFQEQVDRIIGQTPDGKSRVRIIWAMDYPKAWMFTAGELRAKYAFYHFKNGSKIEDIGVPRYYVEELHTNAELQHNGNWDKARYSWIGGQRIDLLGEIPEEGFYTGLFMIAHHDDLCCGGREIVKHQPCYGAFRVPGEQDLLRIRRMLWERDHASNAEFAPTEEQMRKQAAEMMAQRDAKWEEGIHEAVKNFTDTHAWKWFCDDPSKQKWGKYVFTGGHSKSGMSKEEIDKMYERASQNTKESDVSSNAA